MPSPRARRRLVAAAAVLLFPGVAAAAVPSVAAPVPPPPAGEQAPLGEPTVVLEPDADEETMVVDVEVDDTAELDRFVATGVDLDHGVEQRDGHLHVRAVVTPSEVAALSEAGFELGEVLWTADDTDAVLAEREAARARARQSTQAFARRAEDPTNPDVSDVRIIRADYYTSFGTGFLSVEAKWAEGQLVTAPLTVQRDSGPGTGFGSGGTQTISRFADAGVYLYHRGAAAVATTGDPAVPVQPDRVRITSPSGDVAIATVREWLPTSGDDPFKGPGYQEDFIASYLDPTQLYDRVAALAAEFPDQAELVELPFQTNGYRRKSQVLLDPPGNRLVVPAGAASGEYAFVPRTGTTGAVPAGGIPAAPAVLTTVQASANPAFPNATPDMGCGAITPLAAGALALVSRGECTFAEKAVNAQAAGAAAVVVVNNLSGAATSPGAIPASVTIPVVGISQADGATLRRAETAGTPPAARLLPAVAVTSSQRIGVDSLAWGHEGGDDVSIQVVDPGAADQPLGIVVAGKSIQVSSATDAAGARRSTAAEVVAALNAHPRASQLLSAYTYRGDAGAGVVVPTRLLELSDNLNAPDYVSHDPQAVYALRIGTAPEGEKPGVFAYAQEHAREWVPPLVTIEAAERLLRNYTTHEPTRDLVDNLEVWIMPSVNPDGGHYSFYDFASQRRNLQRYCAPTGNFDVNARNSWGVDVNRNYDEYSLFDGYDGASSSCTSDVFAGPSELSEAESRNVDFVAGKPNMRYSMNMHSSGNYFMWSPGAYRLPGRVSAPRPSLEDETYFWQASSRILSAIKRWRGMSVTPARTGVTSDVLYSAAGNSGDMNWYKYGLYAWNFEVGTQFQPPFENGDPAGASAHAEAMEYANGLVELMRVARDQDLDVEGPDSSVVVTESSTEGRVNVRFVSDEATTIRYTLDGTQPTPSNGTEYLPNGVREGGELLSVPQGASIFWYAVDPAGNVENGYDPVDPADRSYSKWRAEVGWQPALSQPSVTLSLDAKQVRAGTGSTGATYSVSAENDFGFAPSGTVTVTSEPGESSTVELDEDGTGSVELGPFTTAEARQITVEYSGDDLTAPGRASSLLTVIKATSSLRVLSVRPDPVRTSGPQAARQARVRVRPVAVGVPVSGPVLARFGGDVIARATIGPDGAARLVLPAFARPGVKTVRLQYSGTSDVLGSTLAQRIRVVG